MRVNPVSGAPGFQTENVFTLAGVPQIVEGMLGDIGHRLETGQVVKSKTVRGADLREGDLAEALAAISDRYPAVSIGSYPWFRTVNDHGVALIARGTDQAVLNEIAEALAALVRAQGVEPGVADSAEASLGAPTDAALVAEWALRFIEGHHARRTGA